MILFWKDKLIKSYLIFHCALGFTFTKMSWSPLFLFFCFALFFIWLFLFLASSSPLISICNIFTTDLYINACYWLNILASCLKQEYFGLLVHLPSNCKSQSRLPCWLLCQQKSANHTYYLIRHILCHKELMCTISMCKSLSPFAVSCTQGIQTQTYEYIDWVHLIPSVPYIHMYSTHTHTHTHTHTPHTYVL